MNVQLARSIFDGIGQALQVQGTTDKPFGYTGIKLDG